MPRSPPFIVVVSMFNVLYINAIRLFFLTCNYIQFSLKYILTIIGLFIIITYSTNIKEKRDINLINNYIFFSSVLHVFTNYPIINEQNKY